MQVDPVGAQQHLVEVLVEAVEPRQRQAVAALGQGLVWEVAQLGVVQLAAGAVCLRLVVQRRHCDSFDTIHPGKCHRSVRSFLFAVCSTFLLDCFFLSVFSCAFVPASMNYLRRRNLL